MPNGVYYGQQMMTNEVSRVRSKLKLSDGEWRLMNLLWQSAPRTIAQMVRELESETGWKKNTIFVMLTRLEEKGAVRFEDGGRSRQYYPCIRREDAAAEETESFLARVYGGSLQMMVSSMAGQRALSRQDIDEVYEILRQAEKEVRE